MGNPDNLEAGSFRSYIRMLYDQFLCCFCHNAEVWLSLISFVLLQTDRKLAVAEARGIFHQAIEYNPCVNFLRTGLAELEELGVNELARESVDAAEFSFGDFVAAESALRGAFENDPGGFTFSVYQRFVRRHRGKLAARKLFGATLSMRNGDPKLGFEVGEWVYSFLLCFFSWLFAALYGECSSGGRSKLRPGYCPSSVQYYSREVSQLR